MNFLKNNQEELQSVLGVLLVGAYMGGWLPLDVLVPVLGLLSAAATTTLKRNLKKAGRVAEKL